MEVANLNDETQELLDKIAEDADNAVNIIENLRQKLASLEDVSSSERSEGISLLHLKNLQMLDYMLDLTYLMYRKCHGKSIENDAAIERIVEYRTVMEKMRPMEKKLKYQIDKFIRLADNVGNAEGDPLHYKPNLQSMVSEDDDEDDDSHDDGDEATTKKAKETDKKYVVPKHVPALPDDDLTRMEMESEAKARAKKKTLSKSIMEDLKRQYMDTPEEEHNQVDHMKAKYLAEMRERTRYEEENFVRLPAMSKKEKHKRRKSMSSTMTSVGNELTYFGSNNFYNNEEVDRKTSGGGKKRKSSGKKGSAKKKFKRR